MSILEVTGAQWTCMRSGAETNGCCGTNILPGLCRGLEGKKHTHVGLCGKAPLSVLHCNTLQDL